MECCPVKPSSSHSLTIYDSLGDQRYVFVDLIYLRTIPNFRLATKMVIFGEELSEKSLTCELDMADEAVHNVPTTPLKPAS